MIRTIVRLSWINLRRDRVALALTFLLPIAFFSVFALVFGGMDRGAARQIKAALVVEDESTGAVRMRELLTSERGLRMITARADGESLTRSDALDLIHNGSVDAAIVIPSGFSAKFLSRREGPPEILLFANATNPFAEPVAEGLLQAASLKLGFESVSRVVGRGGFAGQQELIRIRVESTLEREGKRPSVAFFAAGIGVMFLLFAVSGRSAILIEERENGVLTRLLSSQLTMGQLLLGRWLFLVILGFLQVTIMFIWASIAFGLDLWSPRHLTGFLAMTGASAAAAAGFGLVLATACRSRAQLNGVASVLILVMSAIGGSMFPRFLMPDSLQRFGLFTFNAWALDGYQKVFWFEAGLPDLAVEIGVLLSLTVVFILTAGQLARRWQAV